MKFDLMTMIALLAAATLICATSVNPYVVFGVTMVGLPVAMMLVAITSPKQGTTLNVTSRWYFFLLAKTWCFTVGFLIFAILFATLFVHFLPRPSDRIWRMTQGDFRARVVYVEADLGELAVSDLKPFPKPIYDESGLVGECRYHGLQTFFDSNNNTIHEANYLRLHTDRSDLQDEARVMLKQLPDGKVFMTIRK